MVIGNGIYIGHSKKYYLGTSLSAKSEPEVTAGTKVHAKAPADIEVSEVALAVASVPVIKQIHPANAQDRLDARVLEQNIIREQLNVTAARLV